MHIGTTGKYGSNHGLEIWPVSKILWDLVFTIIIRLRSRYNKSGLWVRVFCVCSVILSVGNKHVL